MRGHNHFFCKTPSAPIAIIKIVKQFSVPAQYQCNKKVVTVQPMQFDFLRPSSEMLSRYSSLKSLWIEKSVLLPVKAECDLKQVNIWRKKNIFVFYWLLQNKQIETTLFKLN